MVLSTKRMAKLQNWALFYDFAIGLDMNCPWLLAIFVTIVLTASPYTEIFQSIEQQSKHQQTEWLSLEPANSSYIFNENMHCSQQLLLQFCKITILQIFK